ncbi:hypothetical protein EYZ11_001617 [Aspergillus tanneri]|uniref:Uncharacterized protein n=1 Tax=Aspergillus tanneri TaxID=1220188 RepID=A0A4V3UQF7_9EURO|nr:uncharacterized protein ATNIH1004_006068 [Aspergillus tanneri]KAA8647375.1 hypothetical protein ATNIH1004_006068 [Aspergillus tanneri]THC98904.1 hypothetical protein EYZ11_001617 [Aspergillus tanneri]
MAPIRRYLRISKYTVLECRIYLDNPSDARWLLDSRNPVLPRIFTAIRPLVLPKLREENERLIARKKGHPVKDVITEEDFEVSLFLRESRTIHSLLTRHKEFEEPGANGSSGKVKVGAVDKPAGGAHTSILVESDSETESDLRNIPQEAAEDRVESSDDWRAPKRRKGQEPVDDDDDDKKLRFKTNYEGFNIYGWVLCLLVTRKGGRSRSRAASTEPSRQALMEEWISTQAQGDLDEA